MERPSAVTDAQPARKFTLHLHRDEKLSVLVSLDGVEAHAVFLPKSQIVIAPDRLGAQVNVTVPDWLVKEKGLLARAGQGQRSLF